MSLPSCSFSSLSFFSSPRRSGPRSSWDLMISMIRRMPVVNRATSSRWRFCRSCNSSIDQGFAIGGIDACLEHGAIAAEVDQHALDDRLELASRHTPHRAGEAAAVLGDRGAGVVQIRLPGFVLLPAGTASSQCRRHRTSRCLEQVHVSVPIAGAVVVAGLPHVLVCASHVSGSTIGECVPGKSLPS